MGEAFDRLLEAAYRAGGHGEPRPDESWTKAAIQEWLDGRGVEYPAKATKAELLALEG
jgi:hypothetical protein